MGKRAKIEDAIATIIRKPEVKIGQNEVVSQVNAMDNVNMQEFFEKLSLKELFEMKEFYDKNQANGNHDYHIKFYANYHESIKKMKDPLIFSKRNMPV